MARTKPIFYSTMAKKELEVITATRSLDFFEPHGAKSNTRESSPGDVI